MSSYQTKNFNNKQKIMKLIIKPNKTTVPSQNLKYLDY